MADAGVARDPGRLPWLEPYRAPRGKQSNRNAGAAAAIGAIGLAAVLTLLMRDAPVFPAEEPEAAQASVVLPAPVELGPAIVLPPLAVRDSVEAASSAPQPRVDRPAPRAQRRKIKAVPTDAAYREVLVEQSAEVPEPAPAIAPAAVVVAALPLPMPITLPPPPDPPRPAVNRAAQVVRGKTVQLGVYKSARQAEAAWRSAIRDYTFLVTMPKSIEPISIRSKRFYRLQLGTPSKKHARQLCTNLKTTGRACTVA